ncbi:unnamed protein product [Alopecurus aequalis]
MAEAARARPAPLHPGLPDEIFIWEILLRLPPKALLRCRAVCRGWRRATSARDFLLANHRRQPSSLSSTNATAPTTAAGLLVLCTQEDDSFLSDVAYYSVCNLTTRQYAPLPQLRGFCIAGMYPHPPTREYRLLLCLDALLVHDEPEPAAGYDLYVYALGSCEPPRDIGWPEAEEAIHTIDSVLFRGGLHWFIEKDENTSSMIMVFDTTLELFRNMRAPAVPSVAELFEMNAMLGMASFSDGVKTIDIWMTQDYDNEIWAFRYRVELPFTELTVRFGLGKYNTEQVKVVSSWDDDAVLILVQSGGWLLQIGMDGKLVSSFHCELLVTTQFRFKQTLVPHTFFTTIEGYVQNDWPFISPDDDYVVDTEPSI